tara:strand:+ start:2148 stop:2342 length:195 start_codon:yes stop_codon:yes gene_type:complete
MYKKKSDNKKPNKPRALKKEEVDLFKTHSKNYSKKHIDEMKKYIRSGKGCFSEAHKHANKKVGK